MKRAVVYLLNQAFIFIPIFKAPGPFCLEVRIVGVEKLKCFNAQIQKNANKQSKQKTTTKQLTGGEWSG